MKFERIAGALGAEVMGLDLTAPIPAVAAEELREALARYQALFFRDQPLSPAHHRALAEVFGTPQTHAAYPTVDGYPEISILEVTEAAPPKIDTWHTDMTFMARPPLGSILHGGIIPPVGGDTLFASLTRAYETLSPSLQTLLDGVEAEHSFAHGFRHSLAEPGGRERLSSMLDANPPRRHPAVRTHPQSDKKVLFVNRLFTTRLIGFSEAESAALLELL
ncbi:MAG: TauD/TfdA family dioxygenase, partial [Myxococcota bacterium]